MNDRMKIYPAPPAFGLRANPGIARARCAWPFGPIGIRQERRKPYRVNDIAMGQTSLRRWNDSFDAEKR
jgi:hypothetical protein